jgi:salicylate hydroxylase
MASSDAPILIAGAGIAGLSLALGLARRGVACRILEKRNELSEAGAGIQLGPNAMHVLTRLGVADRLSAVSGHPARIEVSHGQTGRRLGSLPLGAEMAARYGAPYLVCHRADLQEVLAGAVAERPLIELLTGFEVSAVEETPTKEGRGGVVVRALDGRSQTGPVLVGADGLWSLVRPILFPSRPHRYAGKMAARTLVPANLAEPRFKASVTGVWLGVDAHVVHYPVRAGREIAVVVIVNEATAREGWGGEIQAGDVLHRLSGFAPELLDFLQLGPSWRTWSLYDPAPLPAWSRGRIGLMGDAAHPILPFLAQGGGMAIEDAETLARLLARLGKPPEDAFTDFEALRRDRVGRVQDASRENGRIYHLTGVTALARNAALALVPGGLMMQRYDWLYRWDGDGLPAASSAA